MNTQLKKECPNWKSVPKKIKKKIAEHERVYGNNKWQLDPDHYLDLFQKRPMAFEQCQAHSAMARKLAGLLREPPATISAESGGDRWG